MNLHPQTQDILRLVEEETQCPVLVQADASLPTLASVIMARGEAPAHIVRFRPDTVGADYLIAYQSGFILRQFQKPPEDRYDFIAEETGQSSLRYMLAGPGGTLAHLKLPDAAIDLVAKQFFDSLMTQLRSVPIGMRIDAWLFDEYPDLQEEQVDSLTTRQRENAQTLEPEVRDMVPPPVFSANAAMNAALALFFDRLLGQTLFIVPYRAAGFEERGRDLLTLWDETPSDPLHDQALVDAWGDELGLSDWYRWQPVGTNSSQATAVRVRPDGDRRN